MNKRVHDVKPTIIHLLANLDAGGCERVVLNLQRETNRQQFNCTIFYWEDRTRLLQDPMFKNADVHRLHFSRVISIHTIFKLIGALKKIKASIIHTHLIDADLLGFIAAKILRIPHFITLHSHPYPTVKRHCLRYKIMSLFGTRFICVSQVVKNHAITITGIAPNKLSVVYSGINLACFSATISESKRAALKRMLTIPENAFVIGLHSRLAVDKGHYFLLDAIPGIRQHCPTICCVLVGEGTMRDALQAQASRLGITEHIIFTGTRTDIPEMLSLMDIFVCTSPHEALGLVLIEAMAMARPIVAVEGGAFPELMTHEKEGLFVPYGDSCALASAVVELYSNKDKRETLALAAAIKAKQFSSIIGTRELEQLYLGVLNGRTS